MVREHTSIWSFLHAGGNRSMSVQNGTNFHVLSTGSDLQPTRYHQGKQRMYWDTVTVFRTERKTIWRFHWFGLIWCFFQWSKTFKRLPIFYVYAHMSLWSLTQVWKIRRKLFYVVTHSSRFDAYFDKIRHSNYLSSSRFMKTSAEYMMKAFVWQGKTFQCLHWFVHIFWFVNHTSSSNHFLLSMSVN